MIGTDIILAVIAVILFNIAITSSEILEELKKLAGSKPKT